MNDISSTKWKNETCSDTKSAPNDWKIKHKGLLLERGKNKNTGGFSAVGRSHLGTSWNKRFVGTRFWCIGGFSSLPP